MGKLDDKKKQKRDSLLMAAFALFTQKGINDTSISDIAKKANMAKGTFYLYFKDKFDIRDKLIADKARQVFCRALEEMNRVQLDSLEDHVIFLINSVINQLNQNKNLLKFISKNLSWGVLSVGVCIYPASQPALVSGITYGFSKCVGVQRDWTCIFICSV